MADDSSVPLPLAWAVAPHLNVTGKILMGLVEAPANEVGDRHDHRSQIDVEIHGRYPEDRADSALSSVASLLAGLSELKSQAEALAPTDWKGQYRQGAPGHELFLEGFEFHDDGRLRVLFDFGNLDLLILDLHPDRQPRVVVEH